MDLHYTMVIEWSDEDQLYLVRLPEWGPYAGSHGTTYEAAAKAGREVLEMLVQQTLEDGKPLPQAGLSAYPM